MYIIIYEQLPATKVKSDGLKCKEAPHARLTRVLVLIAECKSLTALLVLLRRDSAWKPQARTQVDLSRVDRVQTGQRTRKFSRFSDKHRSVNGHSLSLIYGESVGNTSGERVGLRWSSVCSPASGLPGTQ